MSNLIGRRELFAAGLGLGASLAAGSALAQSTPAVPREAGTDALGRRLGRTSGGARPLPKRMAKTTQLFLSPPGWPNAIDVDHDKQRGFWVQEQRHDNKPEAAWLLDWNGKLLHTVMTHCKDTSGMCYGNGYVWSGANGASVINPPDPPINGVFQTDENGKQISHRQIPFGPKNNGGATHGMSWQVEGGKIWIASNRMQAMIRIDPATWEVDYLIPTPRIPGWERMHGIAYDNGFIWQVAGHQKEGTTDYAGYTPGLLKYDVTLGRVIEIVEFVPGSCDIHDVTVRNGQLYGVDAGEHPGWSIDVPAYQHPGYPPLNTPTACYVCRIDLL
jgi:hypothetical protein